MKGVKDNIFLLRPTLTTTENSSDLSNNALAPAPTIDRLSGDLTRPCMAQPYLEV